MKKLFMFVFFLLITSCAYAQHLHHKADYQKAWCAQKRGVTGAYANQGCGFGGCTEEQLRSREIGCLLELHSVEFAFAENWEQVVNRARFIGQHTNGGWPGVVLIMEDIDRDCKYLIRLLRAIDDDLGHTRVWIMEPGDLQE